MDAANVVGSRPNGWWRDRGGAAARLCHDVVASLHAGRLVPPVVVVVEGVARAGVPEGADGGVRVVHAPGNGDDTIAAVAAAAAEGETVVVVTADRELRQRTQALGCEAVGPRWLLDRIEANPQ